MATDAHPGRTTNTSVPQQMESDASQTVPCISSSAGPRPGHEFDVFLSFRGSDNRKTFTDNLYHRLLDAGIRTFRDDEELEVGEEIGPKLMKSVKQSKIAIPIFSKDYASSKWCLNEFAEIVKCKKDNKLQIMPIFLDVTPDEVQHQRGSYADSFARHENKFGSDTVQGWRKALQEVVKLKGLELKTVANGHEGLFIKYIVAIVMRDLKKSHLKVTDILVGIDDPAEEIIEKLEVGTDDTRVVGIWGMGGIGKTTLAKFVYNRVVDEFPSNSFLSNIQETSRNRGLQYLQSKLAFDILRREENEYADIGDVIKVLEERLRDKKAMILLDNVDHIDQLSALAKDLRWFGRGSRIIITTREKQVLDQYREQFLGQFKNKVPDQFQVQDPYEVALLDKDQAFELFCKHAFRDKLPKPDFVEQAWEAVNICGRLPLALEVIGSSLSVYGGRKNKDIWNNMVNKLKEVPHKDVHAILKISYDSLDRKEMEIFLDIACFFIGMDVRLVIPFWHDSELYPESGIEILKLKALIKIGENNTIWMHDLIRDLGRDIVKLENYKEPGGRSRVWHGKDTHKVFLGRQGTSKAEAISVEGIDYVTDDMFRNLSSLKLLELDRVRLDGNFRDRFHELKWLSWHRQDISPLQKQDISPLQKLILKLFWKKKKKLILKNLIILDLSLSSIANNWMSSIKVGVKLKVLNLRYCQLISSTPDFSAFPSLEILILAYCGNLIWVDPSIGILKNLILLNLRKCRRLEQLPEELGKVESLVELLIDETKIKKVPISPGMKKLEILSAKNCRKLEELPDSIGQLTSLVELTLSDTCVTRLSIGNLLDLELLKIDGTKITCVPGNLGSLTKLKVLDVSRNFWLHDVEISDEFLSLSSLMVLQLTSVKRLPPSLSALSCLQTLCIGHSPVLQSLPKLPSSLLSLTVEASSNLIPLDLPNLANLKELYLYGEFELKNECFSSLTKLEKMCLTYIKIQKEETLPNFGNLLSLKQLAMHYCSLKDLPDLSKLKNLERLQVQDCRELVDIQGIGSLGNCLKMLELRGCSMLSQVEAIAGLESLRDLNLSECTGLRELPNLLKLQRLEKIDMTYCVDIDGFPAVLRGLSNLKSLHLFESKVLIAKLGDKMKALSWYRYYIARSVATKEEDKEAQDMRDRGIITKADEDDIREACYKHYEGLIREVEINGKLLSISF